MRDVPGLLFWDTYLFKHFSYLGIRDLLLKWTFEFHKHLHTQIMCNFSTYLLSYLNSTLSISLYSFIHSLVFSLRGRTGRNQSPVMWPVWLWHTASWASSWGVVCHCFPLPLDVAISTARCLYVRNDARDPSSKRWNCGRETVR